MENRMLRNLKISLLASVVVSLVACGGGGGSSGGGTTGVSATSTGVFKDSNVSGMNYSSGTLVGVTDTSGTFEYVTGQNVTFSVGGVVIGTVNGRSVVTPVDLVAGGNTSSLQVQNIVRFLMMLDLDGDPTNGITISSAVQTMALSWPQIDFTTSDLAAALSTIISDAASVDGTSHTLPSALVAQAHMESTLLCIYAGGYRGTYRGSDNGPFGAIVDAKTGLVSGIAYSNVTRTLFSLSGVAAVSFDQTAGFVSGVSSSLATYSGQFTSPNQVSGTWQNAPDSGTFSGNRVGGVANAAYRFTGMFGGGDYGLYTIDVDGSDNVSGIAYSITADQTYTLSGTVSGTSFTATASDGTNINGTLNKASGTLSGTWVDTIDNLSGTYSGSGCKLN